MNLVGCLRKLEFPSHGARHVVTWSHGDRHTVIMNAELNRNYRGDIWHLDSYRMNGAVNFGADIQSIQFDGGHFTVLCWCADNGHLSATFYHTAIADSSTVG